MAIFEFSLCSDNGEVHSLSLGDLTITGNEGTATTKGNSRYSMMVFLSIAMFMDTLQTFFLQETLRSSRECHFMGIDGSFEVSIVRGYKRDLDLDYMIGIEVFGNRISREPATQFIREFWNSVEPFVNRHRPNFKDSDSDLDMSMKEFAEAFADILNDN